MALFDGPARAVEQHAHHAVQEASPWVQSLARLGYAAKGVVYVIIGALAAQAAFGGRQVEGHEGALGTILEQPFGRVLLVIVAVGLAGFVLWRFVQAALNPEHKGDGAKGLIVRIGLLMSAVTYAAVTMEAVRMIRGSGGGGEGNGAQHWTARLMEQPFGRIAVGLVGAGIAAYGLYEIYKAFTSDLGKRLDLASAAVATRRRVVAVGRAGTAARGVVFGIIGWLVIQAALQYDPAKAQGLEAALGTLRQAAYGPYLLLAVALGLIAYGLFQLVKARYRVIRPA
ncbi:MAG TPA: DUF1206 domain-containing protein [Longimicrobium sp.]|nr:DUF1206 domain-containing protein [Longimicrobium sp.]